MAEAFSPRANNRLFAAKSKKKKDRSKQQESNKSPGGSPPDSGYEHLRTDDTDHNGYILEDGQIIVIDKPSLEALNKYAYDVIKV